MTDHASDCAVHNMPAYPNGPCDCGAMEPWSIHHHHYPEADRIVGYTEIKKGASSVATVFGTGPGSLFGAEYISYVHLIAAGPDMLAALGPLAMAASAQADELRHQARSTTSGAARVLIEAAERWEALHDAASAAIAKAEGR